MVVNLGSPQGWHRGANYRSTVKLPVDFSNLHGVKGIRGVVVPILLRPHVHRFVGVGGTNWWNYRCRPSSRVHGVAEITRTMQNTTRASLSFDRDP